jgi:hypothetical protein
MFSDIRLLRQLTVTPVEKTTKICIGMMKIRDEDLLRSCSAALFCLAVRDSTKCCLNWLVKNDCAQLAITLSLPTSGILRTVDLFDFPRGSWHGMLHLRVPTHAARTTELRPHMSAHGLFYVHPVISAGIVESS